LFAGRKEFVQDLSNIVRIWLLIILFRTLMFVMLCLAAEETRKRNENESRISDFYLFGLALLSSESKWMNIMKYMRFIILFYLIMYIFIYFLLLDFLNN
jgi:hypothetical protein